MLTIRPEQRERFEAEMAERFIRSAAERALSLFPEAVPEKKVERENWIREGIGRAESHGFTTKEEMFAYLDSLARFGVNFDRHAGGCPWAERLFALTDVKPADKAAVLDHYLSKSEQV